jgi:WD40 repeat protein
MRMRKGLIGVACLLVVGGGLFFFLFQPAKEIKARLFLPVENVSVHQNAVWSPDGLFILYPNETGITMANATTGKIEKQIHSAYRSVDNIAVSDREIFAAGLRTYSVSFEDVQRLRIPNIAEDENDISTVTNQVEVNPDQGSFAVIHGLFSKKAGSLSVYDLTTGTVLFDLTPVPGSVEPVLGMVYSPDGRWLVTTSRDGTARIWDAHTGTLIEELKGMPGKMMDGAFAPDGTVFILANDHNTATVWDTATWTKRRTLTASAPWHPWFGQRPRGNLRNWIASVSISPDGALVAFGSSDAVITIWSIRSGRKRYELAGHTDSIKDVAFSPDGQSLLSISFDGTVRVWDLP